MVSCRLCGTHDSDLAFRFDRHTVVNNLCASQSNALKSRIQPFAIYECHKCGFLFSPGYYTSQKEMYSEYKTLSGLKPQPHAKRLVERIKQDISSLPNEASVFEIGCNDGSFIKQLQNNGFNAVIGIEPTSDSFSICRELGLNVINDFFSSQLASQLDAKFDVIVTRQVLEHIEDLHDFIKGIKIALKKNGVLVIEVPDTTMNYMLHDYTFWEQHINYFTISTLQMLLEAHGLQIYDHEVVRFSGTAITVFATVNEQSAKSDSLFHDCDSFKRRRFIDRFGEFQSEAYEFMCRLKETCDVIKVYGCGNRSQNFLNHLQLNSFVDGFLDDCPTKTGFYTPMNGHPIENLSETEKSCAFLLGVNAESEQNVTKHSLAFTQSYSILPPSRRLPDFWKNFPYKTC